MPVSESPHRLRATRRSCGIPNGRGVASQSRGAGGAVALQEVTEGYDRPSHDGAGVRLSRPVSRMPVDSGFAAVGVVGGERCRLARLVSGLQYSRMSVASRKAAAHSVVKVQTRSQKKVLR